MNNKTMRKSNIELMRIVCILMIIGSHFAQWGGNNLAWDLFKNNITFNHVILNLFGSWGKLGVLGFIIISSYFMIDSKKFKVKKIILLILETFFYCISFILIGLIINDISIMDIFKELIAPFHPTLYWFLTTYLFFCFLSPFLNKCLNSFSKEQLKRLIIILTLFIPCYNFLWNNVFGGQISIFIYIYILIFYLKDSPSNFFENHCKCGFLLTSVFIITITLFLTYIGQLLNIEKLINLSLNIFINFNILIIFDAIFMFYIFKNLEINNSRLINTLAKTSLGVYIIHDNWLLRKGENRIIWHKILKVNYFYNTSYFFVIMPLTIIAIFVFCAIVDVVRSNFIEKKLFNNFKFLDKICDKFDNWYNIIN